MYMRFAKKMLMCIEFNYLMRFGYLPIKLYNIQFFYFKYFYTIVIFSYYLLKLTELNNTLNRTKMDLKTKKN
jgi:hypothetical protein